MIVGTAGHIDHGKTALVRALTGVDTDRLPEEKARGISIDLGYAYSTLGNGEILGFIDVPGHERFVHTMLAGATGIDFALLVVAADDGVMPQTREHLQILSLLGLHIGAIALTKTDRADDAQVAAVEADVRVLLAPTPLADAPIFRVSSLTGTGIDALNGHLERSAAAHRRARDNRHFRLAVDRSFTLHGIGTVVTGTVHSGEVHLDDQIVVAPSGRECRVRSIHAQNRRADEGVTGQRCALNLVGIARDEVKRGDWIVAPAAALSTARIDVELTFGDDAPLRSGAPVHVHVGAAHATARLVFLDSDGGSQRPDQQQDPSNRSDVDLTRGSICLAQLVLASPIAAWRGDRVVVRDVSASRTLGGGRVLDPFAPSRHRRANRRLHELGALSAATVDEQLAQLTFGATDGIDLRGFARAGALKGIEIVGAALGMRRIVDEGGDFGITNEYWDALQERVVAALTAFHSERPDELGPDHQRLKRIAVPRLDNALYRAVLAALIAGNRIRQEGPWLRLPTHSNAPSAQERALVDKAIGHIGRSGSATLDPPWVRDTAAALGHPEAAVRAALLRASKRGELFQIVRDLFYHPLAIRELAVIANRLQDADGDVRAATFRDATGLGRKRAIQVLEFFDRVGYTRRVGDRHLIRGDFLLHLGSGDGTADARDESDTPAAGGHAVQTSRHEHHSTGGRA